MSKLKFFPFCVVVAVVVVGCQETDDAQDSDNPLLSAYETPFEVPPFDKIKDTHFRPAFKAAIDQHNQEVDVIINDTADPTFENTIVALENSGRVLGNVSRIFFNLNSANTNDSLQAIAKDIAPVLSAHGDDIWLNEQLFTRVKAVYNGRESFALDAEDSKLLEETYKGFVRAGANLSESDKEKLKKINAELSVLTNDFGQNLLAETNAYELVIDKEEDLVGLPAAVKQAAAEAAKAKGKEGKWVFTLQNPSVTPFLQYADNRALRHQIWNAYQMRGNNGNVHDNKDILLKTANLRLEKANLLGYDSHAAYVLEEAMAENPENVYALLNKIWQPALERAKSELAGIQALIREEGGDFEAAPHDWKYYQEKIRQERYALNEEEVRPYFSLEAVRQGAFDTANKLYGLSFVALSNVPRYHEEVEVYEVKDRNGEHLGLLYADFFPRESKRGGAWMTSYRPQSTKQGKRVAPVISIVCNFTKPVGGEPALLTFDEALTLFHEFGHALHGLLSDVKYQSLAGTSVSRDFVELPSQVMENWAADPEVLKTYAKHYKTGEVIPDSLVEKIVQAATFDQGFATVEYVAASLLDLDYHAAKAPIGDDVNAFEAAAMERIGLIEAIIPRYRSSYFQHIFSGGYAAGYYAYIWAEVLDADAFAAFKERGLFDQPTAASFRKNILEKGGTGNPAEMYRKFRGQDPDPLYLMKKRGLH